MAQRKLLTNGSAFLRTDGRWAGVVWYMDERGEVTVQYPPYFALSTRRQLHKDAD